MKRPALCAFFGGESRALSPFPAGALGLMSQLQFWTKFYSQLGRPLPKVGLLSLGVKKGRWSPFGCAPLGEQTRWFTCCFQILFDY